MNIVNKIFPHFIVLMLFVCISFAYFSPILEGKKLDTHDVRTWKGMSKEIEDFRQNTGKEPLWTNSMFSGMPAYQISVHSKGNFIKYFQPILSFGMPKPVNILFLYLLGFYILLLSLKVDYRLSFIGAIAFAFSSYFFIIIEAGHITKAYAIAYMPMVIASVLYTYRGKMLLGGVLTALTVALEINSNHLQITYYLFLTLIILGVFRFIKDYRNNNILEFIKRTGVLFCAAILASGTSFTTLLTTMEYGKDSTRGKSELTTELDNKTTGLDKDYATSWSYGIAETFTLLIPNFHGGASQASLTTDSETYNAIKRAPNAKRIIKKLPLYWGTQPFTSGPVYAGAIVIFLFILGLFFVKSEIRSWLLLATIMSIMLAWGKNFMFLTELFLDYVPGYNKFRAVSMILVIAEFTIPLLAFLALNKFLTKENNIEEKERYLRLSFYIVGSFTLLFAFIPSLFFDFVGLQDSNLEQNGWPIDALQSDRSTLLRSDAWRSFVFIGLAFIILWLFLKNKVSKKYVILLIGVLVISDMWTVNKRYLNDADFVRNRKVQVPYQPTAADTQILADKDLNFRVFNQSVSTFNDASTSYFHKSIGGYHGAKLKRYQELIENHIAKGNMAVLNMLNTRYFITPKGQVQQNQGALGNAWFVNEINIVPNADAEIAALNAFEPINSAIVDQRFREYIIEGLDNANAEISLLEYKPNYLKYTSNSIKDGIAIFSEIYYDKGWNAYVDGVLVPHFRANYVLRGMNIPAGNHIIEFRFEPSSFKNGETISFASSLLLLLMFSFVSFKELRDM